MADKRHAKANADAESACISPPMQRATRLLRHIAEGDPVTSVSRTARDLNINRTTLLRLLHTLGAKRFIEQRPEGQGWRIGIMKQAHLGILDGLEVVYLVRRVTNRTFANNNRIGSRLPTHVADMGRIMLAHLPPKRVDQMYAGVVPKRVTPQTSVTLSRLHEQLRNDRAAGLAWSYGNYEPGISSVAAAIFDATAMPVAALNVSGHSADFVGTARRAAIGKQVQAATAEISERLGWRDAAKAAAEATPVRQRRVAAQKAV